MEEICANKAYLEERAQDHLCHTRISIQTGRLLYELGDNLRKNRKELGVPVDTYVVLGSDDPLVEYTLC